MCVLIWLVTSFLILVVSSFDAAASTVPAGGGCDRCVHQSNVTFFSNDDKAVLNGACGYGIQATKLKGGRFAGATPVIYNQGVACGECFQVRCNDKTRCTNKGTTVIVTDLSNETRTGFVLSKPAFMAMAKKGKKLPRLINAEYQRVPCNYRKMNMSIRVEETSKKQKGYLAIKLLYQGGQTNIESIEVGQTSESLVSRNWVSLTRSNYGAVWKTSSVPEGALKFKFLVTAGYDWKYYMTNIVMPGDWTNGVVYDSGIQITDIGTHEACKTCSNVWKP